MMSETVVTVESGNRNNAQAPPKPAGPQQSSAGPLSWITFNTAYFQSVPGLLKLIQLVSKKSFGRNNPRKCRLNLLSLIEYSV